MIKKILLSVAFTAAFLILSNSPLADCVKVPLIFRNVTVPVFQWIMISFFAVLWRYAAPEPWKKVAAKGIILGLVLSLYPLMLETLKLVWGGVDISRMYVLYIKVFVFGVTTALSLWGAVALAKVGIFLPISMLSLYGIYFYYSSGHWKEAAILIAIFSVFLYLAWQKTALRKIAEIGRSIFGSLLDAKTLIILVFAIALLLRLAFLFSLLTIEGPRYPLASDDGDTYDKYGWLGVSDPMVYIRESPHYFYVFYSVLLTIIYKIFGHSFLAAGVIQSIMGALLCCLIFILAFKMTKNALAAFLSGLGSAFDPTLIHLFVTLNNEVLYIPFIVIVILALLFYRELTGELRAISLLVFGGFLLGLATIVRTPGIGLAAFIVPWILIWGRDYSKGRLWKRLRDGAIFTLLVILTIMPIIYINYRNTNEFFLIYNNRYKQDWKTPVGYNEWSMVSTWGEGLVPSNKKLIELGVKDPMNKPVESIMAIMDRPRDFLKASLKIVPKRMKGLYLWPNFGNSDPIYLLNPSRIKNRYAANLEFYALLLSVLGLAIFISSRIIKRGHKVLLFLVVIYYTILHGIFYLSQTPRYAAPMWPFLYIAISFGAMRIYEWLRSAVSRTTRTTGDAGRLARGQGRD